jgi:hypothetical protein
MPDVCNNLKEFKNTDLNGDSRTISFGESTDGMKWFSLDGGEWWGAEFCIKNCEAEVATMAAAVAYKRELIRIMKAMR